MCGINGFNWNDPETMKQMNRAILHRGPDDQGIEAGKAVSLGHLRLSILDPTVAGHQPMSYQKEKGASSRKHHPDRRQNSYLSIVFNGEIYNFREIKEKLRNNGYVFTTETDTEVILAAYDFWGTQCVERFHGMWAFAIHDQKRDRLFCSRDRFGKKPFFYCHDGERFIFSSEIKGILQHDLVPRKSNEKLISDYFYFDLFRHTDETFFQDIFLLEPSTNLIFDLQSGTKTLETYYQLKRGEDQQTLDESVQELDRLLCQSVDERLVSDVPIAISLSGGVDSSTISGYLNQLGQSNNMNAFTTSFEAVNATDETKDVQKILERYPEFKLNKVPLDKMDFLDHLEDFVWHQEEPVGLQSLFVRFMIARSVHEHGLKVLITGEGADEIFAGYGGVFPVHLASKLKSFQLGQLVRNFFSDSRVTAPGRLLLETLFLMLPVSLKSAYLNHQAKEYKSRGVKLEPNPRTKAETFSFTSLDDYLFQRIHKSSLAFLLDFNDKMGMANSIESRSPFVDYRLLEFGFRTSEDKKIRDGHRKYILKKVGERFVPEEIIWNRKKEAFASPAGDSIKTSAFKEIFRELFHQSHSEALIDSRELIRQFETENHSVFPSKFILKALFLEMWFRQFRVS